MKKSIPCIMKYFYVLVLLATNSVYAQDFTWIKGTSLPSQTGIYGTLGTAAITNNPGGREGACTWKDASGNFWMFGGDGYDFIGNFGILNDMWKYTATSNQWTWVKGDDIINQIGNYGTKGVSAATNKPGGRSNSVSWLDASGNFWLFGGFGFDAFTTLGYLNDLWKYSISTNQWTWVSGSNACYQPGNYGTLGVSSPSNVPGARYSAVSYSDASYLWLLTGFGNTTTSLTVGSLNDVWKYDISLNEWTWVNGSNVEDQNGSYGSIGTSAPSNIPGGREGASAWKDASGNFWLFGGDGWDATTTSGSGLLSDLWKYSPANNEWTWMKGNSTLNQIGVYGAQGIANVANFPGGRLGAATWIDAVGHLWLYAGEGYPGSATTNTVGGLNDLWKFNSTTSEWTWVRGSAVLNQSGNYGTQGIPVFTNIPGSRSFISNWIDANNNLWFFGGYGQPAVSAGSAGNLNDLWKYTNCFISPVTLTVSSGDSVICAGETTSLTVSGGANYTWPSNNTTNNFLVIKPNTTTTYSVYTTDNNSCKYYGTFTQTVEACTSLLEKSKFKTPLTVYPNPNNGEFQLRSLDLPAHARLTVYNAIGQLVYEKTVENASEYIQLQQSSGIYFYQINLNNEIIDSGKIVVKTQN